MGVPYVKKSQATFSRIIQEGLTGPDDQRFDIGRHGILSVYWIVVHELVDFLDVLQPELAPPPRTAVMASLSTRTRAVQNSASGSGRTAASSSDNRARSSAPPPALVSSQASGSAAAPEVAPRQQTTTREARGAGLQSQPLSAKRPSLHQPTTPSSLR